MGRDFRHSSHRDKYERDDRYKDKFKKNNKKNKHHNKPLVQPEDIENLDNYLFEEKDYE